MPIFKKKNKATIEAQEEQITAIRDRVLSMRQQMRQHTVSLDVQITDLFGLLTEDELSASSSNSTQKTPQIDAANLPPRVDHRLV